MKKDTFYFPHDFGARNDPKLQNVLMEHGCEGLGIFWCVVEQIYEQGGSLPFSNCKSIAFALHVECKVVESVVNDFNLFNNDGNVFWSESIRCRLNKRDEISEKRREAGRRGWQKTFGNSSANDRQMPSNQEPFVRQDETICPAIKGNEMKLNKNKEEGIPEKSQKRFSPPSINEISNFVQENGYSINPETFFNFYSSNGWQVGKNKMKDWKAAVRTWNSKEYGKKAEIGRETISNKKFEIF